MLRVPIGLVDVHISTERWSEYPKLSKKKKNQLNKDTYFHNRLKRYIMTSENFQKIKGSIKLSIVGPCHNDGISLTTCHFKFQNVMKLSVKLVVYWWKFFFFLKKKRKLVI